MMQMSNMLEVDVRGFGNKLFIYVSWSGVPIIVLPKQAKLVVWEPRCLNSYA